MCAVGGEKPPFGRPARFQNADSVPHAWIWDEECLIAQGAARLSALTCGIPATAPHRACSQMPSAPRQTTIHMAGHRLSLPSTDPSQRCLTAGALVYATDWSIGGTATNNDGPGGVLDANPRGEVERVVITANSRQSLCPCPAHY